MSTLVALPPIHQSHHVDSPGITEPLARKRRQTAFAASNVESSPDVSPRQRKPIFERLDVSLLPPGFALQAQELTSGEDEDCLLTCDEYLQSHRNNGCKMSADLADQLTHIIDMDIRFDDPDLVLPEGYSTFVKRVGQSDNHFLEGFLNELAGRVSPHRRTPIAGKRKSPLAFYIPPLAFYSNPTNGAMKVSCKQPLVHRSRGTKLRLHVKEERDTAGKQSSIKAAIARKRRATVDYNVMDEHEIAKRLGTRRREACESLRMLCFGAIGNEHWKEVDKHKLFEQRCGSMEELATFVDVWTMMDDDGSGDIDAGEFMDFFARNKNDRLLCMRAVKYLLSAARSHDSHGRHRKVTREDMLRLLWLKATSEDVAVMLQMFDFQVFMRARVPEPPRLPKKKRRELIENFKYLDKHSRGRIAFTDLVSGGLVDEHMMKELSSKYDLSGDGILSQDVFLEMLCPYGVQAHDRVQRIAMADDSTICKVEVDCTKFQQMGEVSAWISEANLLHFRNNTTLPIKSAPPPAMDEQNFIH